MRLCRERCMKYQALFSKALGQVEGVNIGVSYYFEFIRPISFAHNVRICYLNLGAIHIPRGQIFGNFDPPSPFVVKRGHLVNPL